MTATVGARWLVSGTRRPYRLARRLTATGSRSPKPRTGRAGRVGVSNRSRSSRDAVCSSVITRLRRGTLVSRAGRVSPGPGTSPLRNHTRAGTPPAADAAAGPPLVAADHADDVPGDVHALVRRRGHEEHRVAQRLHDA